jgi:hypothetical protein
MALSDPEVRVSSTAQAGEQIVSFLLAAGAVEKLRAQAARHGLALEVYLRFLTERTIDWLPGPTEGNGDQPPSFPKPGTEEWGRMNRRRAELIRKDLAGTLSDTERTEYEELQRRSLAEIDAAFPFPKASPRMC